MWNVKEVVLVGIQNRIRPEIQRLSYRCLRKVAVPPITCNNATGNFGCFMMQASSKMIVGFKDEENVAIGRVSRVAETDAVV
jgi:hypothetical protein